MISEYLLSEIDPRPGIERLMTQSIINYTREIALLEKVRARLASLYFRGHLIAALEANPTQSDHSGKGWTPLDLVRLWSAGDPEAQSEVRRRLSSIRRSPESIADEAYIANLDDMERLGDLIGKAEHRRDKLIRTLQGNRAIVTSLALRELRSRRLELQIADALARQADPAGSEVDPERP